MFIYHAMMISFILSDEAINGSSYPIESDLESFNKSNYCVSQIKLSK